MNAIAYPVWEGLERAVRTDGPARGELTAEQQKIFSEGVEALTAGSSLSPGDPVVNAAAVLGSTMLGVSREADLAPRWADVVDPGRPRH
jgi:hypothetical protein